MAAAGSIDPMVTIAGLTALFRAELADKFDDLDTEYDDAIVLNDVADDDMFWAPLGPDAWDRYPCLPMTLRPSAPNRPGDHAHFSHYINIHFLEVSNEGLSGTFYGVTSKILLPQEVVAIRVSRSLRAIAELVRENPTLPIANVDKCRVSVVGEIGFRNFEVSQANAFGLEGILTINSVVKTV